jgi:hypothetical protein
LQEPLNNPTVQDLSVYDTPANFHGTANPGLLATFGISPEFAITQRWVLAADIFNSYTGSTTISGFSNTGYLNTNEASSSAWAFAPAVEYNWSPKYGVIAGVVFSFAGHNTSSYVEPQVAVNIVF